MAKCPECGGRLEQIFRATRIMANGQRIEEIPGARCQSFICDYVAISINDPATPHPNLAMMRLTYSQNRAFREYSNALASLFPETERDPERCGGRPVFTKSRLPVEVIVAEITLGETDADIIDGYPRMNKFILAVMRAVISVFPQPPLHLTR
jgi:uncharacterized protein (DUF433 family)